MGRGGKINGRNFKGVKMDQGREIRTPMPPPEVSKKIISQDKLDQELKDILAFQQRNELIKDVDPKYLFFEVCHGSTLEMAAHIKSPQDHGVKFDFLKRMREEGLGLLKQIGEFPTPENADSVIAQHIIVIDAHGEPCLAAWVEQQMAEGKNPYDWQSEGEPGIPGGTIQGRGLLQGEMPPNPDEKEAVPEQPDDTPDWLRHPAAGEGKSLLQKMREDREELPLPPFPLVSDEEETPASPAQAEPKKDDGVPDWLKDLQFGQPPEKTTQESSDIVISKARGREEGKYYVQVKNLGRIGTFENLQRELNKVIGDKRSQVSELEMLDRAWFPEILDFLLEAKNWDDFNFKVLVNEARKAKEYLNSSKKEAREDLLRHYRRNVDINNAFHGLHELPDRVEDGLWHAIELQVWPEEEMNFDQVFGKSKPAQAETEKDDGVPDWLSGLSKDEPEEELPEKQEEEVENVENLQSQAKELINWRKREKELDTSKDEEWNEYVQWKQRKQELEFEFENVFGATEENSLFRRAFHGFDESVVGDSLEDHQKLVDYKNTLVTVGVDSCAEGKFSSILEFMTLRPLYRDVFNILERHGKKPLMETEDEFVEAFKKLVAVSEEKDETPDWLTELGKEVAEKAAEESFQEKWEKTVDDDGDKKGFLREAFPFKETDLITNLRQDLINAGIDAKKDGKITEEKLKKIYSDARELLKSIEREPSMGELEFMRKFRELTGAKLEEEKGLRERMQDKFNETDSLIRDEKSRRAQPEKPEEIPDNDW